MPKFFIHRPIFAWVIAIFVVVAGIVSITQLPVSQYPSVAPPTIRVMTSYPGASAETIDETVISLIEREMNGAEGLMYMESTSPAGGFAQLTLTFKPGTDPNIAQVEVQNRLARAEPRLPDLVKRTGVRVDKATANFLMVVSFESKGSATRDDVADYVNRNILPELQRVPGVGGVQLFASGRAMRVWIDPAKLEGYGLTPADVNAAITSQSMQIAGGALGDTPSLPGQSINALINVPSGQLETPEEFGNVVLRARADGSTVRIRDVARVELGVETYAFQSRQNGQPAVAVAVQLTSSGNAMATAAAIKQRMSELQAFLPEGVSWSVPYDTSKFVEISIDKVVHTLLEAIVLVVIVMFVFLQNWRYTLIPTIVVPIALLGTFAVMLAAGLSINILAMFAMVLVIGIVVDDAIVVVENVERIMAEEGLPPKAATIKAMSQISGAVVGITVILVSVFTPLAFFSGATGNIYRQFAIVMATSIAFSGFFALSLTPALCATLLKPIPKGHAHDKKTGFFGPFFNWFNRVFGRATRSYEGGMVRVMRRSWVMVGVYAVIIACVAFLFMRLPTAFLPTEDQGNVIVNVQLPPGATQERTVAVMKQVEDYMMKQPEVENMVGIIGFSFSGTGQNMALAFATLKDWSERTKPGESAQSLAGRATGALQSIRDAFVIVITPPAIPELGTGSGFAFRLLDRNGMGHDALVAARGQLLGMAAQSKILAGVRPEGVEDAPQLQVDINRDVAAAQNVSVAAIANTLGTALGSAYVTDFPNKGYIQRVTVQADANRRMTPEDVQALKVPNMQGQLVPLSTMVSTHWSTGPMQLKRYNGYPSMSIAGQAAPGYSSGDAMAEMERIAAQLPPGFGYEWTGISLDEKKAGAQSAILYAFSILAVFLCLAALYESWSIPLAVILVVPLGVLGTLFGVWFRGMPNDVYFQIGLITVIGLSAKNAILIVEFAKDLQAEGMSVVQASLAAARLRFRPILMTSLAFILGVVPLYVATGASSGSQREIGTGVFWGMTIGTSLAVILVPVFFLIVRSLFRGKPEDKHKHTIASDDDSSGRENDPNEALIP
ncbi:MAG: efflux RND transporter permease subunit [Burkholderiales bacterium]|uniref:efflux RND transporter permease subunit n=1 Tax=Ottowia sp. TaxID=1898956 RepID=UPI001AC1B760|nr:efflux RND transporter permease subunit [Ottowia sp.]MBN9406755.1 efflux RND transporter permease subunit [Burkholderiales bacterium]MBS0414814.1 efflux RND transporter permease subunit [Pseudomonadota bacterium]